LVVAVERELVKEFETVNELFGPPVGPGDVQPTVMLSVTVYDSVSVTVYPLELVAEVVKVKTDEPPP
jgi:hypothetical protein